MKIIFEARDGKQFRNENECFEQESTLISSRFWDSAEKEISVQEFLHHPNNCYYFYLNSEDDKEIILETLEGAGYNDYYLDEINDLGLYFLDCDKESPEWTHIDKAITRLKNLKQLLLGGE